MNKYLPLGAWWCFFVKIPKILEWHAGVWTVNQAVRLCVYLGLCMLTRYTCPWFLMGESVWSWYQPWHPASLPSCLTARVTPSLWFNDLPLLFWPCTEFWKRKTILNKCVFPCCLPVPGGSPREMHAWMFFFFFSSMLLYFKRDVLTLQNIVTVSVQVSVFMVWLLGRSVSCREQVAEAESGGTQDPVNILAGSLELLLFFQFNYAHIVWKFLYIAEF